MKGTSLIEVAPLALAVGLGVQAGQARAQVAVDPAPPVPPVPLQPYEITADARLDALQRQLNEQTQRLQQGVGDVAGHARQGIQPGFSAPCVRRLRWY